MTTAQPQGEAEATISTREKVRILQQHVSIIVDLARKSLVFLSGEGITITPEMMDTVPEPDTLNTNLDALARQLDDLRALNRAIAREIHGE